MLIHYYPINNYAIIHRLCGIIHYLCDLNAGRINERHLEGVSVKHHVLSTVQSITQHVVYVHSLSKVWLYYDLVAILKLVTQSVIHA